VVVSAISYGGYLLQMYLFPAKGYYLTGLIGGTYSSTATTVVLARKQKSRGDDSVIEAAMIAATSVMYLRLLVIAAIFNLSIARSLMFPFVVLAVAGLALSILFLRRGSKAEEKMGFIDKNPLELGTAFVFAALFVAMMALTHYVVNRYGSVGLHTLSLIVGFTDIDPFVLSLLTGKYMVTAPQVTAAVMIAAGSNNLLKAIYALWFGGLRTSWRAALWIAILGVVTIGWALKTEHIF